VNEHTPVFLKRITCQQQLTTTRNSYNGKNRLLCTPRRIPEYSIILTSFAAIKTSDLTRCAYFVVVWSYLLNEYAGWQPLGTQYEVTAL